MLNASRGGVHAWSYHGCSGNFAHCFSKGQHAGSLGPAIILSKQLDLASKTRLLDVAGGSGAFTIMLCKRNPDLAATILDFPTALPTAERFIGEAEFAGAEVADVIPNLTKGFVAHKA